jgi:hypothetical protein
VTVVVTVIGSGSCAKPVGARLGVLVVVLLGSVTCAALGGAAVDEVVGNAALVDAAISAECETDVANGWNSQYYALLLSSRDTHHLV